MWFEEVDVANNEKKWKYGLQVKLNFEQNCSVVTSFYYQLTELNRYRS